MTKDRLQLINLPNIISQKMDVIINAFTTFYGEDKRQIIDNKFRNLLILKVCNTDELERIINDSKMELFKEVFSIPQDKNMKIDIDAFLNTLEMKDEFNLMFLFDDIKNICLDGDNDPLTIIKKYEKGEYKKLEEFKNKYYELKKQLEPHEKTIREEKERKKIIENKYYKQLINEFYYLFSEEDIKYFEKYKKPNDKMKSYLGTSLLLTNSAFNNESEEIINNPNSPSWRRKSIEDERIRFFKANGYEIRDALNEPKYEEYLNDSKCKEFLNRSLELFSKIEKRKEELVALQTREIICGTQDFIQNQKEIDKMNYLDNQDILDILLYTSPVSSYFTNCVLKDGKVNESNLILINTQMQTIDHTIIHELNHAYEDCIIQLNENGFISLTGWDMSKVSFAEKKENMAIFEENDTILRQYELINEYINDRIATDIYDILYSQGNFIVDQDKEKSDNSYICTKFLLESFYQEFKPIIIESRSNGNIEYIYNKLGKENFEQLNMLVNEYYNKYGFSHIGKQKVIDWSNGIVNEETQFINNLINQRNEILYKMKEQLVNQNMEL